MRRKCVEIVCNETGEVFPSIMAAANRYHVNYDWLFKRMAIVRRGLTFERTGNTKFYNAKKVRCVETGKVFSSCREAAQHNFMSSTLVNKCVNGKNENACGLHFVEVE